MNRGQLTSPCDHERPRLAATSSAAITPRAEAADAAWRSPAAAAALATLVGLLGLWRAPLVSGTSGTVRDITRTVSPPGLEQIALLDR